MPIRRSAFSRQRQSHVTEVARKPLSGRGFLVSPGFRWIGPAILILGIGATLWTWRAFAMAQQTDAEAVFERETGRIRGAVADRLANYERLLHAAQGFLHGSQNVTREEWRKFVEAMALDVFFPGVDGLTFTRRVPAAERAAFLERMRAERPKFAIQPDGERDLHYVVAFIEPMARVSKAVGYDIRVSAERRDAAERARDTGTAILSPPLQLITGDYVSRDLLMFLPVFAEGRTPATTEERRKALLGWTSVGFHVEPLLRGVVGEVEAELHFEVFDGERVDRARMIYDSIPASLIGENSTARFTSTTQLEVGGRVWTLAFDSTPVFDRRNFGVTPWIILVGGFFMTITLAAGFQLLSGRHARAQALAEQMTQAWRESELNYGRIISGTAEGYWQIDRDGRTVDVNDALCRMLNCKREDVVGRLCAEFATVESRETMERGIARVPISDHRSFDATLRVADGSEVRTHFNSTTIRDRNGEAVGSFALVSDVSARRKADEALRRSEERYRNVVETFPDAIIMHRDGVILYVNPAAIALAGARSAAALIGGSVIDLVHPDHRPLVQSRLKALAGGMARTPMTEMKFVNIHGRVIEGEVASALVPFDTGVAVQTVVRDVTARKVAESALRHRLALEHLVLMISAALIEASAEDLDPKLDDALQALGEFSQVGRTYLFLRGADKRHMRYAFEWCARGVAPQQQNLPEFTDDSLPWMMGRLRRFEVVNIPRVADLPAEASLEKTEFIREDIHSMIVVPMRTGNELIGFLGLDVVGEEKEWSQQDIGMLRLVAEVFALAIERQSFERMLRSREEDARESRQRLSDAIESISEGFVLWDATDRLVLCNRRFRETYPGIEDRIVTGVTCGELIRAAANRGLHREALGREDEWIREHMERHRAAQGSYAQQLTDGRWIRIAERRTSEGGIVGIRADISELKFREEEARESEARKGAIVRSALDAIVTIDSDGLVVDFNPSAERLFGYRRDEVLHRPLPELIVPPSLRDAHRNALRRYNATGQGAIIGKRVEVPAINAKGEEFPVEITITVTGTEKRRLFTAFLRDLTERRRSEETMRLAKTVFESTAEAIMVTGPDNRIKAVNPAFTAITGYAADEVLDQTPDMLASGRHDTAFYAAMWSELNSKGHWEGEIWNRRKNGDVFPEWASITAVTGEDGKVQQYAAVFTDITQRKEDEERVWRRANFDALTGLPNRPAFMDRLHHAIDRAKRGHGFVLLFLDLDGFKEVNDRFGHAAGDDLLQEATRRLQDCIRQVDLVARLAGDEFVILLQDTRSASHITRVAEKILQRFRQPFVLGHREATVGCSIGVARCPVDGTTAEALMAAADAAMYTVKRSGKNSYAFASASLDESASNE